VGNKLLYAAETCSCFGLAIIKLCIDGLRSHYGVLCDTTGVSHLTNTRRVLTAVIYRIEFVSITVYYFSF